METKTLPKRRQAAEPGVRDQTPTRDASDLVTFVVGQIDEMIEQGVLVPGQRLVEPDIMKRLNVGRVPVREALRILAGDGVVELSSGRSARVRELSPSRLLGMMEFVGAIVELSMKMYVKRGISDASIFELNLAIDDIEATIKTNSIPDIMAAMSNFQEVINLYCKNEYILDIWSRFHVKHYRRHLAQTVPANDVIGSAHKYRKLRDALVSGDIKEALKVNSQISGVFLDAISK